MDPEALSTSCTSNDLLLVGEALKRLQNRHHALPEGPTPRRTLNSNKVATWIRAYTNNETTRGNLSNPVPLTPDEEDQVVLLRFEKDIWEKEFALTGKFAPDDLFKECQRRLYQAQKNPSASIPSLHRLEDLLQYLEGIREERNFNAMMEPTSSQNQPSASGQWRNLSLIPPGQFQKRIKSDFGSHFWALIIGNDRYPNAPLSGCINDAMLVQDYLKTYLGVRPDHITLLKDATRQEMIKALFDLRDNEKICIGDNILIHFSGHGASYKVADSNLPTLRSKIGSIEAICPIDRGHSVPDICDRELNSILLQIYTRKEKNVNITLIVDSCRAGGISRSPQIVSEPHFGSHNIRDAPPLRTSQELLDLNSMLNSADTDLRRDPDTPFVCSESWISNIMEEFAHLAGCHDYQKAVESIFEAVPLDATPKQSHQVHERIGDLGLPDAVLDRGPAGVTVKGKAKLSNTVSSVTGPGGSRSVWSGCFTWALIHVLKSDVGLTGTYEQVIEHIGSLSPRQAPVAIGNKKNSHLWFGNHLAEQGKPGRLWR